MKFIALDLETTGLDCEKDTIIEFAAIKYEDGKIIDTMQGLVNPDREIPALVTKITNITNEMVEDKKPFSFYKDDLEAFIGDLPILGQNISFDIGFLNTHGMNLTNKELDTFILARAVIPKAQSYSLEVLSENFGIVHKDAHRAYDDTLASIKLMETLMLVLLKEDDEVLSKIQDFLHTQEWSWKELMLEKINKKSELSDQISALNERLSKEGELEEHGAPHKEEETNLYEVPLEGKKITEGFIDPAKYDFSEKTLVAMPYTRTHYFPHQTFKLKNNFLIKERFDELLKKDNKWNEEEITAIIKLSIWFSHTKTCETNELKLYNKEYSVVNRINLDEHETHEIYEKKLEELSQKNKIYISHNNLLKIATLNLNLQLDVKNLVVLDGIEFEKSLAKRMTTNIGIGDIEGFESGEMFFGLLGILYKKFAPETISFPEIFVDDVIRSSHEWKQLKMVSEKIVDHFRPHIPPKLMLLEEIFKEEDKHKIALLNAREGEILLRITPHNILDLLHEKLWGRFENIIINDDIVEFENDSFLKRALLLQNFETKKTQTDKYIYKVFPDMPHYKSKDYFDASITHIKEIIKENNINVIVFPSTNMISQYGQALQQDLNEPVETCTILGQGMSGSNGKILNKIENDKKTLLLVSFDFALELIEVFKDKGFTSIGVIFTRFPFLHPDNPYMKYIEGFYESGYKAYLEYSMPKAKCRVLKLAMRYKNEFKDSNSYILDSRIQD